MATPDAIIEAWAAGLEHTADGTAVAPVTWEIRHEAFEKAVKAELDAIKAQPPLDPKAIAAEIKRQMAIAAASAADSVSSQSLLPGWEYGPDGKVHPTTEL